MNRLEKYLSTNGNIYIKAIAHKTYNKYLFSYSGYIDFDDFYQECLINLLYDLENNYDDSRAGISTYIYQRIPCYALTIDRNLKAKKRIPAGNIVSIHKSNSVDRELTFENIISDDKENVDILSIIDNIVEQINDITNKKIFKMYLIGYTNSEIADCVNMKITSVKSRIQYIKNKFKDGKYKY